MTAVAAAAIDDFTSESTTEFDSHENMIVIGHQAMIINHTGHSVEANTFSSDVKSMSKVPIFDAVVSYDCPYSGKTYILVVRNSLYIASMKHNLIPPFILREAGLQVISILLLVC